MQEAVRPGSEAMKAAPSYATSSRDTAKKSSTEHFIPCQERGEGLYNHTRPPVSAGGPLGVHLSGPRQKTGPVDGGSGHSFSWPPYVLG